MGGSRHSHFRNRGRALALAALCGPLAGQEAGAAAWKPTYQLGGFGTLGWLRSSAEGPTFVRDLSQSRGVGREGSFRLDSRLGIQGDAELGQDFRATVQVVAKQRYDTTFRPEVTWAFLAWAPAPELQFRAGRLGFDVFMHADSRDVGYAMLWARPPVECFGTLPISSLDGMDLTATYNLGDTLALRLKGYLGRAVGRLPITETLAYDLKGSLLGGGVMEFQDVAWRFRIAYAEVTFRRDLPGAYVGLQEALRTFGGQLRDPRPGLAADGLRLEDRVSRYFSVGAQYDRGPLQTMGTVARYRSNTDVSPDSWAGFLSAGYRVGDLVPYATVSRVVTSRPRASLGSLEALPLPEAQALVGGYAQALGANQNDQTSLIAGVRWDFASQACLKLQLGRIRTWRSSGLWQHKLPDWTGGSTVLSAVLDFTF